MVDRAIAALRSDPVYVDPGAERAISAADADRAATGDPRRGRRRRCTSRSSRAARWAATGGAGRRRDAAARRRRASPAPTRSWPANRFRALSDDPKVRTRRWRRGRRRRRSRARRRDDDFVTATLLDFIDRMGAVRGGGNPDAASAAWIAPVLLVLLGVGGGALAAHAAPAPARAPRREMAELKENVRDDLVALGDDIRALDLDVELDGTDPAVKADYARAVDAYDRANTMWQRPRPRATWRRSPPRSRRAASRWRRPRRAPRAEPVPERRPPCFFDPRHGPSTRDVEWAPARRRAPARARLRGRRAARRGGRAAGVPLRLVGGHRGPYWDAGPAYAPMAGGYFADGLLPGLPDRDRPVRRVSLGIGVGVGRRAAISAETTQVGAAGTSAAAETSAAGAEISAAAATSAAAEATSAAGAATSERLRARATKSGAIRRAASRATSRPDPPARAPGPAARRAARPQCAGAAAPAEGRPGRADRGALVQVLVRQQREELREVVGQRHALEDLAWSRPGGPSPTSRRRPRRGCGPSPPRAPRATCSRVNLLVADPLPDLRARDLGRRRVLHQVVDAGRAAPAEPERDVLEADGDVVAQAVLGDLARGATSRRAAGRRSPRRRGAACRSGWACRPAPRRTPPAPSSTTSGCATQVPSKPAFGLALLVLLARRRARSCWPPRPCATGSARPCRPSRTRRACGRSAPAAPCRRA